jgi:hypothetical protein
MAKFMALVFMLLAGCTTAQQAVRAPSPCDASEVSYDCQVERYNKVNTD